MLRQVNETHPEATVIGTNNAEVNAPILSINARIGFKAAWRNVDYQVTRDALMNGRVVAATVRRRNEGDGRPIHQPLLPGSNPAGRWRWLASMTAYGSSRSLPCVPAKVP